MPREPQSNSDQAFDSLIETGEDRLSHLDTTIVI